MSRTARIFTNEAMLNLLAPCLHDRYSAAPHELQRQCARSHAIILESAADICATVPFFLELNNRSLFGERTVTSKMASVAVCGTLILDHLHLAGSVAWVPRALRDYAAERLRFIGRYLGMGRVWFMRILLRVRGLWWYDLVECILHCDCCLPFSVPGYKSFQFRGHGIIMATPETLKPVW
jgi:hypothetical protein